MQTLERVTEPEVQVDGVHGEGNGVEVFLEDVVQTPSQVGKDVQMLEGTPFTPYLYAPLELAQVIGEVVSGNAFAREVHARAGRIGCAEMAVINMSGEVAVEHVGEVRTGHQFPAVADFIVGQYGDGEVGIVDLGLYASRPQTGQLAAVGIDDLHVVVLHRGFGIHAFAFQTQADGDSPLLLRVQPAGTVALDVEGNAAGAVAVDAPDLVGQG